MDASTCSSMRKLSTTAAASAVFTSVCSGTCWHRSRRAPRCACTTRAGAPLHARARHGAARPTLARTRSPRRLAPHLIQTGDAALGVQSGEALAQAPVARRDARSMVPRGGLGQRHAHEEGRDAAARAWPPLLAASGDGDAAHVCEGRGRWRPPCAGTGGPAALGPAASIRSRACAARLAHPAAAPTHPRRRSRRRPRRNS